MRALQAANKHILERDHSSLPSRLEAAPTRLLGGGFFCFLLGQELKSMIQIHLFHCQSRFKLVK